jgi:hypothetical protein
MGGFFFAVTCSDDVAYWHFFDMAAVVSDVRCWRQSRKHLLSPSISPFGALRTFLTAAKMTSYRTHEWAVAVNQKQQKHLCEICRCGKVKLEAR